MRRAKKVFLLQEIVPNYRVPVFSRISSLDDVDFTVFYSDASKSKQSNNLKSSDILEGFRNKKIPALSFRGTTLQFSFVYEILKQRPDVVICGYMGRVDTLLSLLLCKLMRIRFLWFQGGVPYKDPEKIRKYATRGRMSRWFGAFNPRILLSRRANGLIAYSDKAKQYYADLGFTPNRIWVAHNSPDTASLARSREIWEHHQQQLAADRTRLSPNGTPVLLMIGRLNKQRRVDTLLSAISILKGRGTDLSLVIVGDGGERSHLERTAESLGLPDVHFEGAVYDDHELCRYLLVSDIFVTPGVASLAIKIAMSMGRPVVSADYGLEVHDIDIGKNGYVFPLGNAEALADKLEVLLESEHKRREIGNGGLRTVREKINISNMVEGFRRAISGEAPSDISSSRTT
jgi:glycosyltransferase involved in cell wall biosynthesis